MNAAPTVEAAFELLAERARILLSADGASLVLRDPERGAETVLATAGARGSGNAGGMASSVSVPLATGRADSITLSVGWRTLCTPAHLDAAVDTLTDLAGLTRIAAGAHPELHDRAARGGVEAYVADLLDALPTAACVADPDTGALVKANRALAHLTGYSVAELLGLAPPQPWVASVEDVGPAGETRMLLRRRCGRLTPVEIRRLPVRSRTGEVSAWVSLFTDVGEPQRVGPRLLQTGKPTRFGELVSRLAHDINNPLFAILGVTELLLEEAEPGSKQRERLELIRSTGGEITDIVRRLPAQEAAA